MYIVLDCQNSVNQSKIKKEKKNGQDQGKQGISAEKLRKSLEH
jgi:hypothetical protein